MNSDKKDILNNTENNNSIKNLIPKKFKLDQTA